MSLRKSVTFTTRSSGRTEFSSATLNAQRFSTSRNGDSPIPSDCTRRKAGTTHGGIIAPEGFAATLAYESITSGFQSPLPSAARILGLIKRRELGSALRITLQL